MALRFQKNRVYLIMRKTKKLYKNKQYVIIYVENLRGAKVKTELKTELKMVKRLLTDKACIEYAKRSKISKVMLFGSKGEKPIRIKITISKN